MGNYGEALMRSASVYFLCSVCLSKNTNYYDTARKQLNCWPQNNFLYGCVDRNFISQFFDIFFMPLFGQSFT